MVVVALPCIRGWPWCGDADKLMGLQDGWRSMGCDLLDLCFLVGGMRDRFAGMWAWLWL